MIEADLHAEMGLSIELSPTPISWLQALGLQESAPVLAAAPRDEEAAAALVAWAGRANRAFCVVGGATKMHVGAAPSRCDFLLSTKYLQHVHDFDEGNATIEAGAGVLLRDLDARARASSQFVPLESYAGATLGGVGGANSSGARSIRWGAPRDLVLGVRAALSDGRVIRGGGKVVKNVAGYDLPKLFVGSRGSLGLVTRVTLRLRPLPERSLRAVWACRDLEEAARLWRLLEGREFEWSGLRADFEGSRWKLCAWCEGFERAVSHQLQRAPQCGTIEESQGAECQESWPQPIQIASRVPRSRVLSWLEAALRNGASRLSWDCASGAVRAAWDEIGWPQIADLRQQAEESGGWMVVEKCAREWKDAERVWGARGSDWGLAQRLKIAYDAAQVCSPGRGVGGL